jgi:hypothetical protein
MISLRVSSCRSFRATRQPISPILQMEKRGTTFKHFLVQIENLNAFRLPQGVQRIIDPIEIRLDSTFHAIKYAARGFVLCRIHNAVISRPKEKLAHPIRLSPDLKALSNGTFCFVDTNDW